MDSSSNYKILVHVVLFYDALTSRSLNPIIMGLFIYLFICKIVEKNYLLV